MAREYVAGTVITEIDIPDFIRDIQDDLGRVREAISELRAKMWPPWKMGREPTQPEPIMRARFQASEEALEKEESRLQAELRSYEWLLPPYFEPPHNVVTQSKAKEILRHGSVHGQDLTAAQKRFFGAIAGGQKPRK